MQCSHTALPCVSLRLVPAPSIHNLFRNPCGRSRGRANMTGRVDHTRRLEAVINELLEAIRRLV